MLLSIIIPVYNVELYLRECLDSVFGQDLTDCEVIVVNDGSTDSSRSILREYEENFSCVLTIIDKPNGGLSSARNLGVAYARGDYFYFLDSDDYLKPHALSTIIHAVGIYKEAVVLYLDCVVTNQGKRLVNHKNVVAPIMAFRSFFNYAYKHDIDIVPNAVSYVYSSSYWKKTGLHFEEGVKYEDALFKYQLFVREDGTIKMAHVDDPFYVYRIGREGSLSTNVILKNFIDRHYIRQQISNLISVNGISDMSFRHALFDHGLSALLEAYENGFLNKRKEFWNRQDWKWMRQGAVNRREYSLFFLARINPQWMARYYYDDLPRILRRLTNILLDLAVKSFYER